MRVEHVYDSHPDGGEGLLALILSYEDEREGKVPLSHNSTSYLTPPDLPMQLAHIERHAGSLIDRHSHPRMLKCAELVSETIVVVRGTLVVELYNSRRELVATRTLKAKDVVLLLKGGHGFHAETDVELIEVKQGPYDAERDKVRW